MSLKQQVELKLGETIDVDGATIEFVALGSHSEGTSDPKPRITLNVDVPPQEVNLVEAAENPVAETVSEESGADAAPVMAESIADNEPNAGE